MVENNNEQMTKYAVQMLGVSKRFGEFYANDDITLEVEKGSIHALLGENGAGKSTLMNLLFGFYSLDSGKIKINKKEVEIKNPNMANSLGIGMVHQHFKLVETFTVTQNVILGSEKSENTFLVNYNKSSEKVQKIIDKYDFKIDANEKISNLTVGQEQKVEILKMLYKDNDILIFDEPTGALTPQETKELLQIIKKLQQQGKTIILITHKLNEIKAVAEKCTVIRKGKSISTIDVKTTSEEKMAELMVGRKVNFGVDKEEYKPGEIVLNVKELTVVDKKNVVKVDNISLDVRQGEILGVAGVDGNGQIEFVEAIMGLQQKSAQEISINNIDITTSSIREINELVSYIPQDRHKFGLVLDYTVSENAVLKDYYKNPYSNSQLLNYSKFDEKADEIVSSNDVRTPHGIKSLTRDLSGGNQQKLIIGREISLNNDLLIAVQPTRGVDVGAIEGIHEQLLKVRSENKAILLVSLELDEVMKISDRIAVFHAGKLMGIVDAKDAKEEEIGLLMAGKGLNHE